MKATALMLTIAVLAGCARPSGPPAAAQAPEAEPASPAKTMTASATGTVESVDVVGKKITIAHGPIQALNWPAMTMTFDAPDVDLNSVKPGQAIDFDLAVSGMKGQVTKIQPR